MVGKRPTGGLKRLSVVSMLGWDITDYGMGDFDKIGFSLITIRNGNRAMADQYPLLHGKVVVQTLLDVDALAGSQPDPGAGGDGVCPTEVSK